MKVVVLGGGPGGYVCAIKLAQFGAEVTLVEAAVLGGACLNSGCIPTKALLHVAELYRQSLKSSDCGIINENTRIDWDKALSYKNRIIKKLSAGVSNLVKLNNIELVKGFGAFLSENEIIVTDGETRSAIKFDAAVIAVGSRPKTPDIPGIDLDGVITSTGALSLAAPPKSLAIIGGGVIGCEFAEMYSSLGASVAVIEALPEILPKMDIDLVKVCRRSLGLKGVEIYNNASVSSIARRDEKLSVKFDVSDTGIVNDGGPSSGGVASGGVASVGGQVKTFDAEKVLIAVGRTPNTDSLNLDTVGIKTDRGFIPVDTDTMMTETKNIYAIGDCVNTPQLAHVASAEAEKAAAAIMGLDADINMDIVPVCVYITPELASVGLTERQAAESGMEYTIGAFPMIANGRSSILNERLGMVKILADKADGCILGVHLACSNATEIISQAVLAIRIGSTVEQFVTTIAAHPTVYESLNEAALDIFGRAVHIPPPVKK